MKLTEQTHRIKRKELEPRTYNGKLAETPDLQFASGSKCDAHKFENLVVCTRTDVSFQKSEKKILPAK